MAFEIIKEIKKDTRTRYTYRADESKDRRIKALKQRYGKSFQYLVDTFFEDLLYKLQYETDIFKDLTCEKQVGYVVKDMLERPVFKRFFKKDLTRWQR